jgi:hypothetical protein
MRHSRLIAAQMRLKMNPSLSRRTRNGQPVVGQLGHQRVDELGVRLAAGHELDGVELRRLLEVHVEHALGVLHLVDDQPAGQRRGVRGEDGVGGGEAVELGEHLDLEVDALRDGLDDEPRAVDRGGELLGHRDAARPGRPQVERVLNGGDVLLDVVAAGPELVGRRVEDADVAAAGGEHRRDQAAERPGPHDRDRTPVDVFGERVRHRDLLSWPETSGERRAVAAAACVADATREATRAAG